jgi:hypothetical protein
MTYGFTNDCPGGAQDGSRGLSKAIPPECRPKSTLNPGRGSRSAWIGNRRTDTTSMPGKNYQTTPIRPHDGPSRGRFRTNAEHHGTAIGRAPPVTPGTARSGTPFGVRALVGLCSGGTAARNPRLPSDTPPGVAGPGIEQFSCLCGGFPLSRPETDRPEGLSPRCGIGFQPVVTGLLRRIASTPSRALDDGRPGEWSNLRIHFQRLTDQKVCHHVVE